MSKTYTILTMLYTSDSIHITEVRFGYNFTWLALLIQHRNLSISTRSRMLLTPRSKPKRAFHVSIQVGKFILILITRNLPRPRNIDSQTWTETESKINRTLFHSSFSLCTLAWFATNLDHGSCGRVHSWISPKNIVISSQDKTPRMVKQYNLLL